VADENLDNLPPEEKIKKLKELEKKRKQEIDDARKKIQESEKELTARDEWARKVPIPQIAQEDLVGLGVEGKEILEVHKGIKEKKEEVLESVDEIAKETEEEFSLEALAKEKVELPPEIMQSEYAQHLSQQPMGNIFEEIKDIYHAVEEKGYISKDEERKVEYLASAVERKVEDVETGKYSFTESVAMAASMSRSIGSKLRGMYQSGSGVDYKN